jgi:hypothetical protein
MKFVCSGIDLVHDQVEQALQVKWRISVPAKIISRTFMKELYSKWVTLSYYINDSLSVLKMILCFEIILCTVYSLREGQK